VNGTALPREAAQVCKIGQVLASLAGESAPELTTSEQLLEADQAARQGRGPAASGRLVSELDDPFALEAHRPVVVESGGAPLGVLPPYVRRGHDKQLAAAVAKAAGGRSVLAVLVGGRRRARPGWIGRRCTSCQPHGGCGTLDPPRPEALLISLPGVSPRTAVWLNETQLYLITAGDTGERIAAAADHAR
jgi:hypothetical protein